MIPTFSKLSYGNDKINSRCITIRQAFSISIRKTSTSKEDNCPYIVIFSASQLVEFPGLIFNNFLDPDITYGAWFSIFDNVDSVQLLGRVLFVDYYLYLLLAGIVLLLSLIGAVVLTLKFDNTLHYQIISRQMARDANSAVFFIR